MPKALLSLCLCLLMCPSPAAAGDCIGPGGGGGGGGGWGILAVLGFSTVVCLSTITTAATVNGGASDGDKDDQEPDEPELTEADRLNQRQLAFIGDNAVNLRRDAAYGRGEYLDAYLSLLGCEQTSHPAARELIRVHGQTIFERADTDEILARTRLVLGLDDEVAKACGVPMPPES